MEDREASLVVAKAMFWPRMLFTIIVMGDWVAESMMKVFADCARWLACRDRSVCERWSGCGLVYLLVM